MKFVLWIGALIIQAPSSAKVDLRRRGIGEAWGWWETENMPMSCVPRLVPIGAGHRDFCRCRCTAGLTRCTRQSGVLIPLDTKSRPMTRVHESDIIQLGLPDHPCCISTTSPSPTTATSGL